MTTELTDELLPCPFCGVVPELNVWPDYEGQSQVACENEACDVSCHTEYGKRDSAAEWNRRAAPQAPDPAASKCSPTLTECPRCKNDITKCDGLFAPEAPAATPVALVEAEKWARVDCACPARVCPPNTQHADYCPVLPLVGKWWLYSNQKEGKCIALDSKDPHCTPDFGWTETPPGNLVAEYPAALLDAFKRHELSAGECPPQSRVLLASSVQRLLVRHPLSQPAAEATASPAVRDVIAERERQKSVEGWTPEHDDEHYRGELAAAGAAYALHGAAHAAMGGKRATYSHVAEAVVWPFDGAWWKPQDARRDLVKAGALILAEIERLDRAAAPASPAPAAGRSA